jgi:Heterokaryon incompatibility protein (HET)
MESGKNSSSDKKNVAATDVRYKLVEFANKSTEGIPLFKYNKLEDMKKRIRLLRLFAGPPENPHVECELFEGEFDKDGRLVELPSAKSNYDESTVKGESKSDRAPGNKEVPNKSRPPKIIKYEALSWRWGAEPSHQILIRKGTELTRKPAHEELVWALKYLRQVMEDRILWIDALCIDQTNTIERNHQVEMMARIYSVADGVCIWLGIDDRESRLAIKFIKDEVMKLQQFDELCEKEENSEKWQSLLTLMQRSWFSRRWVVQEIALARKAKIYCGPDEIDWNQFAIAVELFVEVETATHRLSEVMKKDRRYYHVPGWFEYVSELGASLLVQATGTIFRDEKKTKRDVKDTNHNTTQVNGVEPKTNTPETNDSETKALERRPLLSLEHLVSTLSAFDVSEPRDAVYALLAIANDTSPLASLEEGDSTITQTQEALETFTVRKRYMVDYEKPYEDICKDFIAFCIDRSCKDNIASTRALDILCRPWAPVPDSRKNVATGKEEKLSMALPSWIPQLSGASFGMISTPGIGSQKMDRMNADTLVGYPMTGQRNYNAAQTWGIDKATLKWRKRLSEDPGSEKKSELSKTHQFSAKPEELPEKSRLGEPQWSGDTSQSEKLQQPGKPGRSIVPPQRKALDPSIGSHYSMYVKGFVLDTVERTTEASQNGAIPKEWIELAGWERPLDGNTDAPEEFWRTLVADRGRDGRNPPVYYAKACKESVSKGGLLAGAVNTTSLIHNERNSIVAQFCRRVQAVIWNRSLIHTNRKRLGLVAKGVRKGDLVCILYGCSVPVILRRCEKPKTPKQIEEELRYDVQELVLNAVEAGKRRKQRLNERRDRYTKRSDDIKSEIIKYTKEAIDKLEAEMDEHLKRVMSDWLEFQRRKEIDWPTVQRDIATGINMQYKQIGRKLKEREKVHTESVDQWVDSHKVKEKGSGDYNAKAEGEEVIIEAEGGSVDKEAPISPEQPMGPELPTIHEGMNQKTEKVLERIANITSDELNKPERNEDSIRETLQRILNELAAVEEEKEEMGKEAVEPTADDDKMWYYTFLGECYIHGMMDGEAIGESIERGLDDHIFELR